MSKQPFLSLEILGQAIEQVPATQVRPLYLSPIDGAGGVWGYGAYPTASLAKAFPPYLHPKVLLPDLAGRAELGGMPSLLPAF